MHLQLPLMFGDEEHLIDLCNAFRLVPIVAHTCGRPPEGIRGEDKGREHDLCVHGLLRGCGAQYCM